MTRLHLVSWQEMAAQPTDTQAGAAIRSLSPLRSVHGVITEKALSKKALLLAVLAHFAVFAILLAAPADEVEIEKEPSPPMLVSLIATPEPASAPVVESEIIQPEPPKPEQKPIVKQQKPKPKPKPKVEPVPEPVAEPTAQPEESLPPIAHQPPIQAAPAPQPVAVAPKVAEPAPAPEPEPEPVIEPPRFGVAYLKNPPPAYPSLSRRVGEEGRVVLRVLVAANGKAETVEVEDGSGSTRLDNAALDAVRKWQFIPAKRDNQPISAYVLVPVKFSLDS